MPLIERLLRLPRGVAIRIGPDRIARQHERQLGRILNRPQQRDRFERCEDRVVAPWNLDRCDTFEPQCDDTSRCEGNRPSAPLHGQSPLREPRHDAICRNAGSASPRRLWDEPVGYAYQWMPAPVQCGAPPPDVVCVPGVVRQYLAPPGRLVDVVM